MKNTKTQKQVLHLDTMTILDGTINIKDIKLNKLNILVGKNSSGKSYINAHVFFSQYILFSNKLINVIEENITTIASQIFNNPLDGVFEYIYDEKHLASFSCVFEKGICKQFKINCNYDLYEFSSPIYMSTTFRTFTAIKMYLLQRQTLLNVMPLEQVLETLLKSIKLYDVLFIEMYIQKCPIVFTTQIIEEFERILDDNNIFKDAVEFNVDLTNNFYIEYKNGDKKYMDSFSTGVQSLVNMLLISK